MRYTNLPPVGSQILPALEWVPTKACGPRAPGTTVEELFMHRWGISVPEAESIYGVVAEFENVKNQASAHIVYAGEVGKTAGRCVQMVPLHLKAWTEAADNSEGISIECGDEMWLGGDPVGFARAARIAGWLIHEEHLPATWVHDPHGTHLHGISRHADGGAADGGHTACPTTDLQLFGQFVERVRLEVAHGGYRKVWARP